MSQDVRSYSVELAFRRLRMGVLGCCWIVGLALTVQLVVWSLSRYTEMRYETRVAPAPPAQVVSAADEAAASLRIPPTMSPGDEPRNPEQAINPNHVFSKYDDIFRESSTLASAFGKLGYMMLMPLLAVGVFLSAGSGAAGVHKSVSAFTWSLVLAILVLPLGSLVNWHALSGAFYEYSTMIAGIDASQSAEAGAGAAQPAAMYFARYLMLPAVCVIGTILIGFRFSLGVEDSLIHRETRQFDPVLERETSNRSATSLHGGGGGRSAGALSRIISSPMTTPSSPRMNGSPLPNMPPPPPMDDRMPAATKVSAGEAPRRLI